MPTTRISANYPPLTCARIANIAAKTAGVASGVLVCFSLIILAGSVLGNQRFERIARNGGVPGPAIGICEALKLLNPQKHLDPGPDRGGETAKSPAAPTIVGVEFIDDSGQVCQSRAAEFAIVYLTGQPGMVVRVEVREPGGTNDSVSANTHLSNLGTGHIRVQFGLARSYLLTPIGLASNTPTPHRVVRGAPVHFSREEH